MRRVLLLSDHRGAPVNSVFKTILTLQWRTTYSLPLISELQYVCATVEIPFYFLRETQIWKQISQDKDQARSCLTTVH